MENYQSSTLINATADTLYNALTNEIPSWWTEMFEGSSNQKGDTFTIRFGENVRKVLRVEELSTNTKVAWFVTEALIDIPQLNNKAEWIGTTIIWEIKESQDSNMLTLTHIGLHPNIECYDICNDGWQQFTKSLKLYAETGTGSPYRKK